MLTGSSYVKFVVYRVGAHVTSLDREGDSMYVQ
jgi:hypothetical protein